MNSLRTIAKLATLVVIGGGTIGAAVGITQAQSFHDVPQSADAERIDDGKLYLQPNGRWMSAGARFAVCLIPSQGNGVWKDLIPTEDYLGNKTWYCEATVENYDRLVFTRMNPNDKTNSFDSSVKWSQTSDLYVNQMTGNCFQVKPNTWDKGGGCWFNYKEMKIANLWAKSDVNWANSSAATMIECWGNNTPNVYCSKVGEFNGYMQFKVPCNLEGFKAHRMDSNYENIWNTSSECFGSLNSNIVNYIDVKIQNNEWKRILISGKPATEGSVTAGMFKEILQQIKTCDPDKNEGYNAYPDINTNFYSKLVEGADLENTFLNDYKKSEYDANNKSYNGLTAKDSINLNVKWTGIERAYTDNKGNPTLDTNILNNTALVAGSVTVLATSLIVGFAYLLKKRKLSA